VTTAVHMLLALLGERVWADMPMPYREATGIIDTVDRLRACQLLGQSDDRSDIPVRAGLLRYLSEPFLALAGRSGASNGVHASQNLRKEAPAIFDGVPGSRALSLAEAQQLRSSHGMLTISRSGSRTALETLFPGAVPELYPFLRGALRNIEIAELVGFSQAAQKRALIWPLELGPDQLATSLERDRERWLATLIELSDRCGLLGQLLEFCRESDRSDRAGAALEPIIRLYNAYEMALSGIPAPA
jgi:hypothetical protein